ncbi:MAG: thiamine pyrophosphate-dependent dehydrogenase E1 component subunit alpha [Candidatus Omnitrophica bacterium]|nr:thiamine pyrophosphate-dependent dehydrogenase E1 component subunit alpha [Candidatus Omnitrophota bacterium]MBU1127568.1 thiamine pyrophosphate-dependent dehydrogenase E1 component subunit alpha [Candidatus Omnitrophota bacterium]MBU1784618.1 thiamine pyrophosphate-dependent dehydrogenase E1 component subunit alpha [Candidatus Omnitrophota bacterium]MBU1852404.1 thiamine pyrophosphate-dependent dehydrogenase E1 component subunit alpha [Candidatus Omnitrophota bacterium]
MKKEMKCSCSVLKKLYITMLRIRLCEESFVEPILNREIRCPVHLYSGEEAIAAGVCGALGKRDYIFGSHRSHGHYLAKGGCMRELVAEIYGKETGCSGGRGGSMHLISVDKGVMGTTPIVAGTIALALGASLASSIRKDNRVTVSFFGDGATGEGVLYECLNFASLKKLPIIFVCENNLYSTHMPIEEIRATKEIYKIGRPFGMKSFRVDGNDVVKVYEKAESVVRAARRGEGPVFIEALTYRFRGHVGPDDNVQGTHSDIRPKAEIEKWLKKDPVKKFEAFLKKHNVLKTSDMDIIKGKIEEEVKEAHDLARKSPYPGEGELLRYVTK